MGDHYIPQYYLKGYFLDGKRIWAFDREECRGFETQVKSVANETRFYSSAVESHLANKVEGPADKVLKAIRRRAEISQRDKGVLAAYMVCMMKRVPRGKEWVRELASGVLDETIKGIERQLDELEKEKPERSELWARRRSELANMPMGFEDELVEHAWLEGLAPEASPKVVAALSRMRWQFLTFDRRPAFLTSDNPLFHFRTIGIGNIDSEVTFPISSNVALWATWRTELDLGYVPTTESWVTQLNRRTASTASRYLFHAVDHPQHYLPPAPVAGVPQSGNPTDGTGMVGVVNS